MRAAEDPLLLGGAVASSTAWPAGAEHASAGAVATAMEAVAAARLLPAAVPSSAPDSRPCLRSFKGL